jgi:hypothetical protein
MAVRYGIRELARCGGSYMRTDAQVTKVHTLHSPLVYVSLTMTVVDNEMHVRTSVAKHMVH